MVVYVDYNNTDVKGRVRLNTTGSIEDLNSQGISLHDGLCITLTDTEIDCEGIVRYSGGEWVAEVDWDVILCAKRECQEGE